MISDGIETDIRSERSDVGLNNGDQYETKRVEGKSGANSPFRFSTEQRWREELQQPLTRTKGRNKEEMKSNRDNNETLLNDGIAG